MTKKPAKKSVSKKKPSANAQVAAAMRQLEKLMASGELIMRQDLDAMLASLEGPSATDGLSDEEADARDEAQQIAFDAMEAETEAEARKLAKRALHLDPDCVDALVVMNDLDARTTRAMIVGLQNAVAAGERSLGAQFIRENMGHFWMLIETRPYMRAMEQLARLLHAEGLNLDAIRVYERMLELNPNDNQGVRDPLLGAYLCVDDLEGAGKLLKKYKDDAGAGFAWGRVLERFLAGDPAGAAVALKPARQANHFVELYMTGKKPIPQELPEMYSLGSEEEATMCMEGVGLAWSLHKDAVFWLLDRQVARQVEEGPRSTPSKAALKRVPVKGKRVQ
jgi:tetratricopeptide (TPR) repeat protein